MSKFALKDMNGSDNIFTMSRGWDGDITLCIYDEYHRPHEVRIGVGPNSGDPNREVKDIKYLNKALNELMDEFDFQDGNISEEDIKNKRNTPRGLFYSDIWNIKD